MQKRYEFNLFLNWLPFKTNRLFVIKGHSLINVLIASERCFEFLTCWYLNFHLNLFLCLS